MTNNFEAFRKLITNPFKFRFFLLMRLPTAFFAGLRIEALSEKEATLSLSQKWFNKNPFNSIYFGILSIAAEVSTGILGLGIIYKQSPSISMLVVKNQGNFYKKATGRIFFTCTNGPEIRTVIEEAIATGEGRTVTCLSTAKNEKGETVAEIYFTWSFKTKANTKVAV